ncbi:ABC transporter permease [Caproiciproducens faecalis]|uniref:ABC transporter permease n=1 Tax=Caproiciproducens faecalis TaxID=2820301 RepID=A0ABS7DKI9_9FIRM|nr:ABC transporter permease [Caproiciproducens faecalis]MBW7571355.1 ABC transporter permease [Caproiciproducens faecalis]
MKIVNKLALSDKSSNPVINYLKDNAGTLIGLAGLTLILSVTTTMFLAPDNLFNILRQVCTNATLAFGMTFVLIIGGIDLSVGSVLAASGVTVVILLERGMPCIPAIFIGVLMGAVFGLINGLIIAYTNMPPFIVTLATQMGIRGISYIITSGRSVASTDPQFNAIGNGYLGPIPIPVLMVAILIILSSVILNKTRFGRRMYATGGNIEAATYSGIKVKTVQIWVYTICGILASIGGIVLASRMYSGQPTAGNAYEGDAIAAAVLGGTSFNGGIGTIGGTLIGALIIGVLNNGLNLLKVSFYWQLVIKGIVILAAVYIDILKKKKNK